MFTKDELNDFGDKIDNKLKELYIILYNDMYKRYGKEELDKKLNEIASLQNKLHTYIDEIIEQLF